MYSKPVGKNHRNCAIRLERRQDGVVPGHIRSYRADRKESDYFSWFGPKLRWAKRGPALCSRQTTKAHGPTTSTHHNTGSGLGALYLLQEISARIVDFEVKSALIGFSVDGNVIQFVDSESGAE